MCHYFLKLICRVIAVTRHYRWLNWKFNSSEILLIYVVATHSCLDYFAPTEIFRMRKEIKRANEVSDIVFIDMVCHLLCCFLNFAFLLQCCFALLTLLGVSAKQNTIFMPFYLCFFIVITMNKRYHQFLISIPSLDFGGYITCTDTF